MGKVWRERMLCHCTRLDEEKCHIGRVDRVKVNFMLMPVCSCAVGIKGKKCIQNKTNCSCGTRHSKEGMSAVQQETRKTSMQPRIRRACRSPSHPFIEDKEPQTSHPDQNKPRGFNIWTKFTDQQRHTNPTIVSPLRSYSPASKREQKREKEKENETSHVQAGPASSTPFSTSQPWAKNNLAVCRLLSFKIA